MPVYAHKDGQWKSTDVAFAYLKNAQGVLQWREVKSAWVYTRSSVTGLLAWQPAFNKFQSPPLNVRGTKPTNSSGELSWEAPPDATKYQVTAVNKTTGAALPLADGGWTTQLSYTLSGLAGNSDYICSVKAAREIVGGADAVSLSSPKWTLSTGHPAVPRTGSETVLVKAVKSDTWNSDRGWKQYDGDVVQGYTDHKSRNGFGGVSYTSAYTQLAAAINYPTTVIPADVLNAADHAVVNSAVVERIYRKNGGPVEPTVEVYAWKVDFSKDPRGGDIPSTQTSFKAPDEQSSHFDLSFPNLLTWAREWVKKTPAYTGLLIWREGGTGNNTVGFNGYCVLRAANNTESEWRLKLTVSWNFNYPALQAPAWTAGG